MKVVVNRCFGGFGISVKAAEALRELGCSCATGYTPEGNYNVPDAEVAIITEKGWSDKEHTHAHCNLERNDSRLVQVVEALGKDANDSCAALEVVEIPDDVKWHIEEYDGSEHIAENHRIW